MKQLLFLLVLISITSCNRNIFENAENANEYYAQNKKTFQLLSRVDLATYPKTLQILTFQDYTNKQKSDLFKQKLFTILEENKFSPEKNVVIKYAYENISEEFFKNPILQTTIINKLKSRTKEANFTDEEIASVFFTINDINYDNSLKLKNYPQKSNMLYRLPDDGGSGGSSTCNMEWCLTCGLTGGNYNCESSCTPTLKGCGWFLQQECTQICK